VSDKPLTERLQVKRGRTLALVEAPVGLDVGLDQTVAMEDADVVLVFVNRRADLERLMPQVLGELRPTAILWLAYPKLTSSLAGDLNRNLIHDLVPAYGLDTVSQIAVDNDWSAMRLKRV